MMTHVVITIGMKKVSLVTFVRTSRFSHLATSVHSMREWTHHIHHVFLDPVDIYMNLIGIRCFDVNMSVKNGIIKTMKEAGKPMSAGEVEKIMGIDRKEINKVFKKLKAEGIIVFSVRCKRKLV